MSVSEYYAGRSRVFVYRTEINDKERFYCYDTDSNEPLVIPSGVKKIYARFLERYNVSIPPIIPNSVDKIGDYFLAGCKNLTKPPSIPNSVTKIGCDFLSNCFQLKEAPRIPDSVTKIGSSFLEGCRGLTEPPIIPLSITRLPHGFLMACRNITKPPIIPDTVTIIGSFFLGNCESLTEAPRIPSSVEYIGELFLVNCILVKEPPRLPQSLTRIDWNFLGHAGRGSVVPGVCKTLNSWSVPTKERYRIKICRDYWKRKDLVRYRVLEQILDLPLHIFSEYSKMVFKE